MLSDMWSSSRCSADTVLSLVLQKAEVSVMSQTECKKRYGIISPRMLCAGVPSGGRDACKVCSHPTEKNLKEKTHMHFCAH